MSDHKEGIMIEWVHTKASHCTENNNWVFSIQLTKELPDTVAEQDQWAVTLYLVFYGVIYPALCNNWNLFMAHF